VKQLRAIKVDWMAVWFGTRPRLESIFICLFESLRSFAIVYE
jgi:hypothetical protein